MRSPEIPTIPSSFHSKTKTTNIREQQRRRSSNVEQYKPQDHVKTASDALAISLNEKGKIDWKRMVSLTGSMRARYRMNWEIWFTALARKNGRPLTGYLSSDVGKAQDGGSGSCA